MRLNDYIQSARRGKEANRLEREALNDPFMQDALDGFDSVAGNHVEIIEELEKKYTHFAEVLQPGKRMFLYWSVAASILLLIGFSFYFFGERNSDNVPVIAKVQLHENESVIPTDSPVVQPEQREEKKEMLVAANTAQKVNAAPPNASAVITMDESRTDDLSETDFSTSSQDYFPVQQEVIMEKEYAAKLEVKAQKKKEVHGKVVDETGEPLIGVSIAEKGTSNETVTNIDGAFTLQLLKDDSSQLIASYIGYEPREINPSDMNQPLSLKPSNIALSEVVVVGYGTQKKQSLMEAVSSVSKSDAAQQTFGEKEFQTYCQQRADKNVCNGQGAIVKVSFHIDETGKPQKIEFKKYSCEEAKREMEELIASSPFWTKTNRKVTVKVKW